MLPKCNWLVTYFAQNKKSLNSAIEVQRFISEWSDQQVNQSVRGKEKSAREFSVYINKT